jgi:hypothetical protein
MRWTLALLSILFLSSAASAAVIDHLSPDESFPFGGGQIFIRVEGAVDGFVDCRDCNSCGVAVLFGDVFARVLTADRSGIFVIAPPHVPGAVDVTVRVPGKPDVKREKGFTYSETANGFSLSGSDWTSVLIPITAHDVHGANGSLWTSELTVHNPTEYKLALRPQCHTGDCPPVVLEAGESRVLRLDPDTAGSELATLWVPSGALDKLVAELRVRDLSRDAEGWGAEIPVVRLTALRTEHHLIDIPTDPRFRVLLRAYPYGGNRVHLRVSPVSGKQVLEERDIAAGAAGMIAVDPITAAVRASGHARVRIDVTYPPLEGPLVEPPGFFGLGWSFVSLTNNATNQVTVITPR